MPYIIKCSGDFQDAERGIVRRSWAVLDDNGRAVIFATRKDALVSIDHPTHYDGIADHNILSHGQLAGYAPVPVWISSHDLRRIPMWAQI